MRCWSGIGVLSLTVLAFLLLKSYRNLAFVLSDVFSIMNIAQQELSFALYMRPVSSSCFSLSSSCERNFSLGLIGTGICLASGSIRLISWLISQSGGSETSLVRGNTFGNSEKGSNAFETFVADVVTVLLVFEGARFFHCFRSNRFTCLGCILVFPVSMIIIAQCFVSTGSPRMRSQSARLATRNSSVSLWCP